MEEQSLEQSKPGFLALLSELQFLQSLEQLQQLSLWHDGQQPLHCHVVSVWPLGSGSRGRRGKVMVTRPSKLEAQLQVCLVILDIEVEAGLAGSPLPYHSHLPQAPQEESLLGHAEVGVWKHVCW